MPKTTIQKYQYGNSEIISPFGPEGDFFYGVPARQRELVSLAKKQIQVQEAAAERIHRSNVEAADMIVREIECSNNSLKSTIESAGATIANAIEVVGDRVCAELSEIQWELQQQLEVSERILEVLQKPRSTESQELVRQGVRNFVNGKYQEAEDRFLRAHDLDNTDYQVLVNLSYIALHKEEPNTSIKYLGDALTLPDNLDSRAKADALWSLARVYYTQSKFTECEKYAAESLRLSSSPKKCFQMGVYTVLAGKSKAGLGIIKEAIQADHRLFAMVLAEPDLRSIISDVESMISELSADALAEAKRLHQCCEIAIKKSLEGTKQKECSILLDKVESRWQAIRKVLSTPSYSECVISTANINKLLDALSRVNELYEQYLRETSLGNSLSFSNERLREQIAHASITAQRGSSTAQLLSSPLTIIGTYIGLGVLLHFMIPKPFPSAGDFMGNLGGPIGFIFWPVPFVILFIVMLFGSLIGEHAPVGWAFEFLLVAGLIIYFIIKAISIHKIRCNLITNGITLQLIRHGLNLKKSKWNYRAPKMIFVILL